MKFENRYGSAWVVYWKIICFTSALASSIQCELRGYGPVYYISFGSTVYIRVLGSKKVICALKMYYVTNCDSCKSLWFVFQKCNLLQLISCYSVCLFQLHSEQKLQWVVPYTGGWRPEGMNGTTIRRYAKHTITVRVPQTPVNNGSHYAGLPPSEVLHHPSPIPAVITAFCGAWAHSFQPAGTSSTIPNG